MDKLHKGPILKQFRLHSKRKAQGSVIMLIKSPPDIAASEITDEALYLNRREWLQGAGLLAVSALLPGIASAAPDNGFHATDKVNTFEQITTYNNFYEFGTDKSDPAQNAGSLHPRPWSVVIDGEVEKPLRLTIEDILKLAPLEDRIYRLRCVEGWSMVIPWQGYSLSTLLKKVRPTSKAKYVEFTTLMDPRQMPGETEQVLTWPYSEGLRLDEAMHPLTMVVLGLYGKPLPNQNGAPIRIAIPWKYGFKSAKSIVRIRFTETQPATSWNIAAPSEYGFYSNVNPEVDHPRWSQAKERRIGEFLRRPTLMFNGYGEQVASMYRGMDLRKFF